MQAWSISLAKITLFPIRASTPEANASTLFKRVWDIEPDNYQKLPAPAGYLASSAQGILSNKFAITCAIQPLRIDFSFSPISEDAGDEIPFGLISNTRMLREEMSILVSKIGERGLATGLARVAAYVQASQPGPRLDQANEAIKSALPEGAKLDTLGTEDFSLQINRPLTFAAQSSAKMNFITRWAVDRLQMLNLPIQGAGGIVMPVGTPGAVVKEMFVANVSFDNNNRPTDTPLEESSAIALLNEAMSSIPSRSRARVKLEGF